MAHPTVLDLETGAATALPDCTQRGGRTLLLRRMEACESLVIYFDTEPALAVAPRRPIEGRTAKLPAEWGFETEQSNCLVLRPSDDAESNGVFRATFNAEMCSAELLLVLDCLPSSDRSRPVRLLVNSAKPTEFRRWSTFAGIRAIDIAPLVKTGVNEISIAIRSGAHSLGPGFIRLMGSFSLTEDARIGPPRTGIADGSWTDQGYPFYSGTGVYAQTINVPGLLRRERVYLRAQDLSDTVEFVVNGVSAGVRPWAPFEVDITALVSPGPNTIAIKVTNSHTGAACLEPRPAGLLNGAELVIC